jgi:hypothetical protein
VLACQPPPTPTPAMPAGEGCHYEVIPTAIEGWTTMSVQQQTPVCHESLLSEGMQVLAVGVGSGPGSDGSENFSARMLRWDTSVLSEEYAVTAAWLRLFVGDIWLAEDDNGYLLADWYDWGTCDPGDHDCEREAVRCWSTAAVRYSADAGTCSRASIAFSVSIRPAETVVIEVRNSRSD